MQAVRSITTLIQNLLHELAVTDSVASTMMSSVDPSQQAQPNKAIERARTHLQFAVLQRQTLCHALFFLAYQTQWQSDEVAALIDLVRDLSNELKVLDPFHDVPSPFEVDP